MDKTFSVSLSKTYTKSMVKVASTCPEFKRSPKCSRSWSREISRPHAMIRRRGDVTCLSGAEEEEQPEKRVAVYHRNGMVALDQRHGVSKKDYYKKSLIITEKTSQKIGPSLPWNRLESCIPRHWWFERHPVIDRIVGLTIHCFVLSVLVLVRVGVRGLLAMGHFILFLAVHGAVERGQLTVATVPRDVVRSSTVCRLGKFYVILARIDNHFTNSHHHHNHHLNHHHRHLINDSRESSPTSITTTTTILQTPPNSYHNSKTLTTTTTTTTPVTALECISGGGDVITNADLSNFENLEISRRSETEKSYSSFSRSTPKRVSENDYTKPRPQIGSHVGQPDNSISESLELDPLESVSLETTVSSRQFLPNALVLRQHLSSMLGSRSSDTLSDVEF